MPRVSRQQFIRITAVAGVSLALGGGLVRALLKRAALHRVRETRPQLGTLVSITVLHPDPATARAIAAAAFAEMERLESLLSRYRPDTPIARLNRDGVVHQTPDEVIEVVRSALRYSELTGGAFDVTVAPVLELYRSRSATAHRPPGDGEVERLLPLVGYPNLELDGRTLAFRKPGMAITLDGIAKGYVVDRTVDRLREAGAGQVLVDAGGDMASLSDGPDADGWRVGIQDPRDQRAAIGVLRLRGDAVATSGDYLEYFTPDLLFHHLLDPRTGRSPEETSSVTVVAARAMDADALATAVFVLGPQAGLTLLDRTPGVAGTIVTKDRQVLTSSAFSAHMA